MPIRSRNLTADLLASIVVFLVALPLCVAIAEACGYPPEAGIISGIIGGIVVGLCSGCPLQVSGPAAGLIILVQDYASVPNGFVRMGWILALAGLMQIVGGAIGLGRWFRAVSPAVILGMLAGIGVIIFAKQFHVMFDEKSPTSIAESIAEIPQTIRDAYEEGKWHAFTIGFMTVAIMALWKSFAPKQIKIVPAAVVAVLVAVLIAEISAWPVDKIKVTGLSEGVRWLDPSQTHYLNDSTIWKATIILALIASAESLLCAAAVDAKGVGPRTSYNRELSAQGLGNAICGVLGVLPITGVIVRSSANIDAGAQSRWSAVMHGLWLILFVLALPFLLNKVPMACLAGILVYTGIKLLELPNALKLYKTGPWEFAIYAITCTAIVITDLLTGVIIGIAVTACRLLWQFSHISTRQEVDADQQRIDLYLEGAGTFLSLPNLSSVLERIPTGQSLHIHLDRLQLVDHAVLEQLVTFQKKYEQRGGKLFLDWDHLRARFRNGNKQPKELLVR